MSAETILSNARIVLDDQVIEGSVQIRDGRIADISEGPMRAGEDFSGDYLIAGLVELHTSRIALLSTPGRALGQDFGDPGA